MRKVKRRRGRGGRRGEKNNEFSGHFVCNAAHLQRRMGSERTSLGPIQWPQRLPRSPSAMPHGQRTHIVRDKIANIYKWTKKVKQTDLNKAFSHPMC
jgi:hypothetical protein